MCLLEGGGGGVEVGPREDLKEDVIAKDVSEGSGEEVIVDNEVSIGDNKNGKGRVVREIHDEGGDRGEEGDELGELRHGGEEGGEIVNVWRGRFRERSPYGKRKKV